jgi:hypothetical protein
MDGEEKVYTMGPLRAVTASREAPRRTRDGGGELERKKRTGELRFGQNRDKNER